VTDKNERLSPVLGKELLQAGDAAGGNAIAVGAEILICQAATGLHWLRRNRPAVTHRTAIGGCFRGDKAFGAVIHDPMLAPVRINPGCRVVLLGSLIGKRLRHDHACADDKGHEDRDGKLE